MASDSPLPSASTNWAEMESASREPLDRATILQYLIDIDRDFNVHQAEIDKYKAHIMIAETKQAALAKAKAKYRSMLSPVHRVPSEVLLKVFEQCCERNDLSYNAREIPPASTLSMVSGRWRDILLSSSLLWSSIYIGMPHHPENFQLPYDDFDQEKGILQSIRLVDLYLKRSRDAPLKIDLLFSDDGDGYSVSAILDALCSHSSRWEAIAIMGSDGSGFATTVNQYARSLPVLKRLELCLSVPYSNDIPSLQLDRFSNSPCLESLSIDVGPCFPHLVLPYTQIRFLDLFEGRFTSALMALSLCPNAEELTLLDIKVDITGDPDWNGQLVVLNKVKSLEIGFDHVALEDPDMGDEHGRLDIRILASLKLPRLESLSIVVDPNTVSDKTLYGVEHLEPFLRRSSCALTSLTFHSVPGLSDIQLLFLLSDTPSLTSLDIKEKKQDYTNRIVTSSFSDHLLVDVTQPQRSPFLPRLTELSLCLHADGLDQHALSRAIISRCSDGDSTLKAVKIILNSVGEQDAEEEASPLEALECFKRVGLRFTLLHADWDSPEDDE